MKDRKATNLLTHTFKVLSQDHRYQDFGYNKIVCSEAVATL